MGAVFCVDSLKVLSHNGGTGENIMTSKKKTTKTPKAPKTPPKDRSATINGDIHKRVKAISEKSGLSINKLINILIDMPLKNLENGGRLNIDMETGDVSIGAAPPKIPTNMPDIKRPDQQGRQMTERTYRAGER